MRASKKWKKTLLFRSIGTWHTNFVKKIKFIRKVFPFLLTVLCLLSLTLRSPFQSPGTLQQQSSLLKQTPPVEVIEVVVKQPQENEDNPMTKKEKQKEIENATIKMVQQQPVPIKLGSKVLLHLGKAGGGTAKHTFQLWGSKVPECHPTPCTKDTQDSELVFVTIRDPIDRFVSGFNWRELLLCNKYNETRRTVARGANKNPKEYCQVSDKERYILHEKYMSNVSQLAMALCQEDNYKAEEDLSSIIHAKYTLSDWLPSSQHWQYEDKSKLLTMVVEPGYDFIEQINNQFKYSVMKQHGTSSLLRDEKRFKRNSQQEDENSDKINAHWKHSSVANGKGSSTEERKDLTAECCLARYLHRDYEIIKEIVVTSSCDGDKSGNCQGALESINKRREKYLKFPSANNLDFCSKFE